MRSRIEIIPYDSTFLLQTARALIDVFSPPPFNENLSLNEALAQVESDQSRAGFEGLLVRSGEEIAGFSWWFDLTGQDLYDRWRPRFAPKENIPVLEGRGVFLLEFGLLPTLQHHGLGQRLLKAALSRIEPEHDWIAISTYKFAYAGLALLKSEAFEELDLTGIQTPSRICLLKTIRRS